MMYYVYLFGKNVFFPPPAVPPTDPPQLPGKCPEPKKGESWIPFRGHCYSFSSAKSNWAQASVDCLKLGRPPGAPGRLLPSKSSCCPKFWPHALLCVCGNQGGALLSVVDPQEAVFLEHNVELLKDGAPSFWIGLYKNHDGEGGEKKKRELKPGSLVELCSKLLQCKSNVEKREHPSTLGSGFSCLSQVSGCGSTAVPWTTPTGNRTNIPARAQNSTPSRAGGGQTPAPDTGSTFARWPKVGGGLAPVVNRAKMLLTEVHVTFFFLLISSGPAD